MERITLRLRTLAISVRNQHRAIVINRTDALLKFFILVEVDLQLIGLHICRAVLLDGGDNLGQTRGRVLRRFGGCGRFCRRFWRYG